MLGIYGAEADGMSSLNSYRTIIGSTQDLAASKRKLRDTKRRHDCCTNRSESSPTLGESSAKIADSRYASNTSRRLKQIASHRREVPL